MAKDDFDIRQWAKSHQNDADKRRKQREVEEKVSEEARQKRLEYAERDEQANADELIADILRVASDDANPFPGTCSRARYRKMGWFPETLVYDLFGNHEEFQREAGLRDTRTTASIRNRRARLKTEERIRRYFDAEIKPWCDKHEGTHTDAPVRTLLVGSDFHGKSVDRFALSVFLDVAERIQPDYICLNGDVVDFYEVGRWSKNPNRILDLQDELDWTRDNILAPTREAAPFAQIDFIIGNHEYRLARYLSDTAPELASLRCLSFGELLGLDEYKINLVWNDAALHPTGKEQRTAFTQNWKVYESCFVCTHGSAAGKTPGHKEIARFAMSGTSGHVHRPQIISAPTLLNPYADWMVTGMMSDDSSGDEYVSGPSTWTTGFGVVYLLPEAKASIARPVVIKAGFTEFGGKYYWQTNDEEG